MDLVIAQQHLISLALGMLIGLQRERAESTLGGIRTFPLVTLLGTICGQLAQVHGGWIVADARSDGAHRRRRVSFHSQTTRRTARTGKPCAAQGRAHFCAHLRRDEARRGRGEGAFRHRRLYAVGVISGLTDMDAITLSTARLVDARGVEADTGWRTILIASLANLAFKGGAVALLGSRRLFAHVALLFGLSLVAGGLILWLWP